MVECGNRSRWRSTGQLNATPTHSLPSLWVGWCIQAPTTAPHGMWHKQIGDSMAKRTRAAQEQAMHECYVSRNHWWKWTTVDEERDYYIQHMECLRCGGHRRWRVSKTTGDPMGNNYNMPDGYYHQFEDGENPQQVRKELRLFEVEQHVQQTKPSNLRRVK